MRDEYAFAPNVRMRGLISGGRSGFAGSISNLPPPVGLVTARYA